MEDLGHAVGHEIGVEPEQGSIKEKRRYFNSSFAFKKIAI